MESYIVINGQRAELTEEQLKALGIEVSKSNAFERVEKGDIYYCIISNGIVRKDYETKSSMNDILYNTANYCTDKALMQQRALHETLNRLLWRFSIEHDGDKIALNHCWGISHSGGYYEVHELWGHILGASTFCTKEIAEQAIEEIIKPFIAEHPDFKW